MDQQESAVLWSFSQGTELLPRAIHNNFYQNNFVQFIRVLVVFFYGFLHIYTLIYILDICGYILDRFYMVAGSIL